MLLSGIHIACTMQISPKLWREFSFYFFKFVQIQLQIKLDHTIFVVFIPFFVDYQFFALSVFCFILFSFFVYAFFIFLLILNRLQTNLTSLSFVFKNPPAKRAEFITFGFIDFTVINNLASNRLNRNFSSLLFVDFCQSVEQFCQTVRWSMIKHRHFFNRYFLDVFDVFRKLPKKIFLPLFTLPTFYFCYTFRLFKNFQSNVQKFYH